MAGSSPQDAASQEWSLNDLSSEILVLIIEQLRDMDPRGAATVRRLSRRMEDIATPISYQTLVLTDNIVASRAEERYPRAFRHISRHTKHVIGRSDLDPEGTKRVLGGIEKLLTIRWRYVDAQFRSGRFWLPSDVLNSRRMRLNKTRLYVEDLPLRDFTGEHHDSYLCAIPTDFLVSLKLDSPAPPLSTKLGSLKTLLLQSRRLERFHYEDRGQGTKFSFTGCERMPAVKELALKSYDWSHSSDEVAKHWDLSHLRSLRLTSVPIFNFLSSVDFNHLVDLRHLHCEDYSAHLRDRRQEATAGLYLLVKLYIRALRSLSISCHISMFGLDALSRHGSSLRVLRFQDHVGFGEEGKPCPTLAAEDVSLLAGGLPHIHTLELDMDVTQCNPEEFLRAVCSFRNLDTLTLHVQTLLRPLDMTHHESDPDRSAAVRTFNFLVSRRARLGGVSWRTITINVGGWRKGIMVRRLGEAWREQNAVGIFAERCFVLQRQDGGGVVIWEERGTDGRMSPDLQAYDAEDVS